MVEHRTPLELYTWKPQQLATTDEGNLHPQRRGEEHVHKEFEMIFSSAVHPSMPPHFGSGKKPIPAPSPTIRMGGELMCLVNAVRMYSG